MFWYHYMRPRKAFLGQAPRANLGDHSGRVNDPSGAGVPNAVVSLTNTSTNAVRNTESSTDGLYTFSSVPPGVYNLKVEHPGFRTVTSNNVQVQVQQSVRLDF